MSENNFLQRKRETLYRAVIQKAEKELIERMLGETKGNQIVASKNLGINRNTIRAKIRQLNIQLLKFKK